MTTILFRNDSLRIAAGVMSCAFFALGPACSDDAAPTYSVPAAAGAAGTLNRGSGTLLPNAPGGVPGTNEGSPGTPGLGRAGAGTGGLPGTGGASGFDTAGAAGSYAGSSSGGVAGTDFGSAGAAATAADAGSSGFAGTAGMGGESDLLP